MWGSMNTQYDGGFKKENTHSVLVKWHKTKNILHFIKDQINVENVGKL